MKFADWRRVLSINLDSVFLVSPAFAPGMKQRGWGRVVNMASSTLGRVVTGFVHYMSSKGGIVGFTRALAGELGRDGVTVNAIAPGLTRSPGTLRAQAAAGIADMEAEFDSSPHAGDQARRSAGRSGRHGVVAHQRRRRLHHRADAERRRRSDF